VKRQELIRRLEALGCVLVRSNGPHDWYVNPKTRVGQPVPRHAEIKDFLARSIIKKLSNQ
jgi:predicted RNA binding protein YcfA (HicA-like mRNA interferase family)